MELPGQLPPPPPVPPVLLQLHQLLLQRPRDEFLLYFVILHMLVSKATDLIPFINVKY